MKSPKCVAKKNEVKIAKKKGGEIAERKRKDWCLEILLSAHVDQKAAYGEICLFALVVLLMKFLLVRP